MPGRRRVERGGHHCGVDLVVGHGKVAVDSRAETTICEPKFEKLQEVEIVDPANGVKVKLCVHEVAGEEQGFRRVEASRLDSECGFTSLFMRKNSERIDQSVVVEFTIGDTGVVRVAEEVVHPIDAEGISDDDFG